MASTTAPLELLGQPWAAPRSGANPSSKDPSVIRFGGRYLMYFTVMPETADLSIRLGVASSDDLRSWHVERVHAAEDGFADAPGIGAPGAIVLGDTVHVFYQSYGQGSKDSICHATSQDGLDFHPNPSNPVFRPQGDWNCGRAIDADMVVHSDKLLMGYATRDPEMQVQMVGVAAAPLTSSFGVDDWEDLSMNQPALKPELDWERECIEAPAFVRRGEQLVMFYAGGYNNEPQQIGYAISTDGVTWKRGSQEPILPHGTPGSWNESESGHPGVLTDTDGRTYLFFQGNNTGGKTNYLAGVEVTWDGAVPVI